MKKGVFSPSKSIIKTDRHTKTAPVIAFFLSMFLAEKFIPLPLFSISLA
jgi:hypothetical protein